MVDAINDAFLAVGDFLLGWVLALPSDVALIVLSIGSAGILWALQMAMRDRDRAARIESDRLMLKRHKAQAKASGDRDTLRRIKRTHAQVSLRAAAMDIKPLLVALLPLIVIANWAYFRMEFHPPQEGEPVRVVLSMSPTVAGELVHLVPTEELALALDDAHSETWARRLELVEADDAPRSEASWTVTATASDDPHELLIRHRNNNFHHAMWVGGRRYGLPLIEHETPPETATRLEMREVRFLGVVPGIPALAFPAWLTAYVVIIVPVILLMRYFSRAKPTFVPRPIADEAAQQHAESRPS
ncbi:MAG: hypothetical protein JJU36_01295 [Phycisphaeraceae bacterium]|nr:hypothetical protein [Phycisphaeraceae bacterium]